MESRIERAVRFIKQSNVLLIGTGAGMGRDSGLPDFRGKHGFWSNYPPFANKFNFMQCANPNFLKTNPHLFWGFYGSRLLMYREKKPHQGYQYLREIADLISLPSQKSKNYFAFTSNVDGHFQAAGNPQSSLLQVHGSLHYLQCFTCQTIQQNKFEPQIDSQECRCKVLPECSTCGEVLRPNVLMFNDYDWLPDRTETQEVHYVDFIQKNIDRKTTLIEIGCGMEVATIRNMMQRHFYRLKNSKLIRINPDINTAMGEQFENQRYVHLPMEALDALTRIRKLL